MKLSSLVPEFAKLPARPSTPIDESVDQQPNIQDNVEDEEWVCGCKRGDPRYDSRRKYMDRLKKYNPAVYARICNYE